MKRSSDRILTTHAGSLLRSLDLLEIVRSGARGSAYAARVRSAVADVVRKQVEHGLDVVDGGNVMH